MIAVSSLRGFGYGPDRWKSLRLRAGLVPARKMTDPDPPPLTRLLRELAAGEEAAREKLLPLVYDRLHEVAERIFQRENPGHTLQPTALVHDAWANLVANDRAAWENRAQFFAVGATVMRRILMDYARARGRDKRGGGRDRVTIVADAIADPAHGTDLLELDVVLEKLRKLDERQHSIVELRFFSGLSVEEVAECLNVSRRTVEAEWTMVKAWLRRELDRERER